MSDEPAHPPSRAGTSELKQGIHRVQTDQGNKAQRLLRVDQIYSRKDRQVHFVKTAKARSKPDRFGKTALVVRRIISGKGVVVDTEVDIKSSHLEEILRNLYAGVSGTKLNKTPPIASPSVLFWAGEELIRLKEEEKFKAEPNRMLINDIGTALRFIEEDFGSDIRSLRSLLAGKEITYDLLWTIFSPKELLICFGHGHMNQTQALKLLSSGYSERPNGTPYFYVEGQVITHDGEDFGRSELYIGIDTFQGAKSLTSLPVFPMKFWPEEKQLREELIDRGKKYIELLKKPVCREYPDGHAIREVKNLLKAERQLEKTNMKGRVMVDPMGFRMHNSDSQLNQPYVLSTNEMNGQTQFTDDELLRCAYWITGFSLTHKTWCCMAVEGLRDVAWNHHAFANLVIDEDRRNLIHGLVKAHRNDETAFDDVIQNKGQGLVGLLSGTPGVGKTLTAEAVAEVTDRPLYMVSAGELGIEATTVDDKLGMILDISRRWGCVLLIDEADVFLGVRGDNLQRDSLVSIFLRRLEYFRGVCILTTNRKSEIDPAFQSRIHFTVHYPELDEASRKAVWTNFLNSVAKSSEVAEFGEKDIDKLARHMLNGRQIKNIVSCAVSLAREQKTTVTVSQIEILLKILID
ncbi:AAA family ATPase [Polyplosphaeria fusca]|uniref:AAA family ATPase n=1 Tax=Polyplosphaeria fusca TaxID=682080 RepID=A0A9P4V0D8_9PLEO|nr:AAA family ATPase [Polyplosphaeria fusca]